MRRNSELVKKKKILKHCADWTSKDLLQKNSKDVEMNSRMPSFSGTALFARNFIHELMSEVYCKFRGLGLILL